MRITSKFVDWDDFKVPEITEEERKFKGIPWRAETMAQDERAVSSTNLEMIQKSKDQMEEKNPEGPMEKSVNFRLSGSPGILAIR